jgi:hypothetical protein
MNESGTSKQDVEAALEVLENAVSIPPEIPNSAVEASLQSSPPKTSPSRMQQLLDKYTHSDDVDKTEKEGESKQPDSALIASGQPLQFY